MKIVEDLRFRFLKQNISYERLPYTENVPFSAMVSAVSELILTSLFKPLIRLLMHSYSQKNFTC